MGSDAILAGQVGVAESYGVVFRRVDEGERTAVCYDGDAFGRVLSLQTADVELRAAAALALSNRGCAEPSASPAVRRAVNDARLALLAEADPARADFARLSRLTAHRLRLRRSEALADRAHDEAVQGNGERATGAATEALRLLALVDRRELAPEDRSAYEDANIRAAAVRWLAETSEPAPRRSSVHVDVVAGRPGETCVRVAAGASPTTGQAVATRAIPNGAGAAAGAAVPLAERCTFGVVFPTSLRIAPGGRTVAIVAAPVAGWSELWLFRAGGGGEAWRASVVPPSTGQPGRDVGFAEPAGFSPDGARVLVARAFHVRKGGGDGDTLSRRFEVLAPGAETVERWAASADKLGAFQRWASPAWRKTTLAVR